MWWRPLVSLQFASKGTERARTGPTIGNMYTKMILCKQMMSFLTVGHSAPDISSEMGQIRHRGHDNRKHPEHNKHTHSRPRNK